MKVKCPYCGGSGAILSGFGMMEEQGLNKCPECAGTGVQDVDISTPALIEELEKRRPCEKCENYGGRRTECINCLGAYIHYMRTATDNYKEANHGKV